MTVSLIVPLRVRDPWRARVAGWMLRRWATLRPTWEIIVADSPSVEWSKPRAVNVAVDASRGDTLVIVDADCTVDLATLDRFPLDAAWAQPFSTVARLTRSQTATVLGGAPGAATFPTDAAGGRRAIGGGLVVVRREVYQVLGGWDERFEGWGAEDTWLGRELTRIAGAPAVDDAVLHHLWHPRDPHRRETDSYARNRQLLAADR